MKISDQWETPKELYSELDREFSFLIDACANEDNAKAEFFLKDATQEWTDDMISSRMSDTPYIEHIEFSDYCVFMNPPYSRGIIGKCLLRAWEFSVNMPVVCLVPVRCLSCSYMDEMDELGGKGTYRKWKKGLEIRHLPRRVKFSNPYKTSTSPNFEVCILIMDRI